MLGPVTKEDVTIYFLNIACEKAIDISAFSL